MEITNIRVLITVIATLTAIFFIILSYLLPKDAILILTIEVILLPTIYIVGNYYAESLIRRRYGKIIEFASKEADELKEKYINEKILNIRLKSELNRIKKNAKTKN